MLNKYSLSKAEKYTNMTDKNQIFTQFYYVSVKKNYVISAKLCHAIQNEEENYSFFFKAQTSGSPAQVWINAYDARMPFYIE